MDHLDLIEAASDAAAALDDNGSAIAPVLAAFGASTPADLDPADRTDLYLEIARIYRRSICATLFDAVDALEASRPTPRTQSCADAVAWTRERVGRPFVVGWALIRTLSWID